VAALIHIVITKGKLFRNFDWQHEAESPWLRRNRRWCMALASGAHNEMQSLATAQLAHDLGYQERAPAEDFVRGREHHATIGECEAALGWIVSQSLHLLR